MKKLLFLILVWGMVAGVNKVQAQSWWPVPNFFVKGNGDTVSIAYPYVLNAGVGDTAKILHTDQNEVVTGRPTFSDLVTFNDSILTTDVKYTSLRTTPVTVTNDTLYATTGSVFTKTLSADVTFKLSGLADGQIITFAVTNTEHDFTVAWSALGGLTLYWSGGDVPTQTTGAKTDIYIFQRIGNNIYAAAIQNY